MKNQAHIDVGPEELLFQTFSGISKGGISILLNGSIGLWCYQANPPQLYLNDAAKSLLCLPPGPDIIQGTFPDAAKALLDRPLEPGLSPFGDQGLYSYYATEIAGFHGGIIITTNDKQAHPLQQYSQDKQVAALLQQLPILSIHGYNHQGEVIYWNTACSELYGYSQSQANGRNLAQLILPAHEKRFFAQELRLCIKSSSLQQSLQSQRVHRDGHIINVQSHRFLLNSHTTTPQIFCIDINIDSDATSQNQLQHLERYDQLTQMPNQRYLHLLLDETVQRSAHLNQQTAVMFAGIDRFKYINSEYGHSTGDAILKETANRIISCIGSGDIKSRFGGDVYVLAFTLPNAINQAVIIANRLRQVIQEPFIVNDQQFNLTISVGLSVSPRDGTDSASLLKHADAALSQAKLMGGDNYVFYDEQLNKNIHRNQRIANDLNHAIDNNELRLVFQPQFHLQHRRSNSCEALLRWQHHELGDISPDEFIPILEGQRSMLQLDYWVIDQCCQNIRRWLQLGQLPPRVFINLSSATLRSPSFVEHLEEKLIQYDIPIEAVGIELTEHVLISKGEVTLTNLKWCRNKGIKIALDDFGTGFSSLSYLTRLPIDIIKIDKVFLSPAMERKEDAELIKAIIAIAHSLSMVVICEGVENKEQEGFLIQHQCEMAQGHLYSKALSESQLSDWIEQNTQP